MGKSIFCVINLDRSICSVLWVNAIYDLSDLRCRFPLLLLLSLAHIYLSFRNPGKWTSDELQNPDCYNIQDQRKPGIKYRNVESYGVREKSQWVPSPFTIQQSLLGCAWSIQGVGGWGGTTKWKIWLCSNVFDGTCPDNTYYLGHSGEILAPTPIGTIASTSHTCENIECTNPDGCKGKINWHI